jgi:hypothetical protein
MASDILAESLVLLIWVLALYGLYGVALSCRGWGRRRRLRAIYRTRLARRSLWLKN